VPAVSPIPSIPAAYDDVMEEYRAIREGCAVDRVAARAPRVIGDASAVAERLRMRPWQRQVACMPALLLKDDGTMVGTATVVRMPASTLIDVSNEFAARSLSEAGAAPATLARIRLRGPRTPAVLAAAGFPATSFPGDVAAGVPDAPDAVLCRTAPERYTLYTQVDTARRCWDQLCAAGARPVGAIALETVRIEDAEPCLERDFKLPLLPAAAGLVDFAGVPAEPSPDVLVAIEYEGLRPLPSAEVAVGGVAAGRVRVTAASIRRAGRAIALCSLDAGVAATGAAVTVGAHSSWSPGVVTARVALPRDAAAPNY
jgi:glycine cleavage system aminomethyltransferase T